MRRLPAWLPVARSCESRSASICGSAAAGAACRRSAMLVLSPCLLYYSRAASRNGACYWTTVALGPMSSILFVSKPIAPPWNDSGKNLVRDLARGLTRHRATVMVRADDDPERRRRRSAPSLRAHSGGFAPALTDQARVLAHLAPRRATTCGTSSSRPIRAAVGRAGRSRGCGACARCTPSRARHAMPRAIVPQLFADVNVVLSRHTERRLREAGLAAERMARSHRPSSRSPRRAEPERRQLRDRARPARGCAASWSIRATSSSARAAR